MGGGGRAGADVRLLHASPDGFIIGHMLRKLHAVAFRLALKLLADGKSTDGAPGKNLDLSRSLKNALRGILFTFINERNFRFECAAAVLVVAAGIAFRISRLEWALMSTNIFFVLALEAKNTSMEMTTNIATSEYDYGAKGSKDASSGGVLLAALSSVVTGLLIFGPRLLTFIRNIVSFLHNQ
jgi:undecaprenol kinase